MHRSLFLVFSFATLASAQLRPDGATASFKGSLPPKPVAALSAEQEAGLETELAAVTQAFQGVKKHERAADVAIFIKAVRYALDFDEWYDKKPADGVKKAMTLLEEAKKRIASLKEDKTPWMDGSGSKVLGFYSQIDGSPQPYGVEIPEGLEYGKGKKPVPMWVWLHGRGDTATDLPFVYGKLMAKKPGQFQPKGTIVIHPFGRYCNGWKSAGETDVFEARDDAMARFNVDENRVALAGFSMGGAGAWHLGAHFADQWACVHTGAGFVDVKRYQKVTPEKMPVWYEQTLWGVYDVPDYVRNFKNVPLISYSGELDGQRDGADYMTEVLAKEGMSRPHLIGPGMGHKYHPEVIKEVQALIEKAVEKGRDPMPKKVSLQTRTLEYSKMFWVQLLGQEKPWEDT
ncbi:MAG: prolyl oligopeptidase family serine peptidase, partial [Prosthecobacter sp.]|nr:prolyl oligopeptidase family serine peptidase [Prosthecobacter sp.]